MLVLGLEESAGDVDREMVTRAVKVCRSPRVGALEVILEERVSWRKGEGGFQGRDGSHTAFLSEEDGAMGSDTTGFKEGGQTS